MKVHSLLGWNWGRVDSTWLAAACLVVAATSCGGESQSDNTGERGGSGGLSSGTSGSKSSGGVGSTGGDGAGNGQGGASAASVSIAKLCDASSTATTESASRYLGCVRAAKEALCRAAPITDSSDAELSHRAAVEQARQLAPGVNVSAEDLTRCANAIATAACSDVRAHGLLDACVPKSGGFELGRTCVYDEQCASLFCEREGAEECGRCSSPANPCSGPADCPERLSCGPNGATCLRLPLAGQPCLEETCGGSSHCENGTCVGLPGIGEPCTALRGCSFDGSCETGLCVRYTNPMASEAVPDGGNCNGVIGMMDVIAPTCLSGSRCVEDGSLPPITGTATGAPYSVPAKICRIVEATRCE
jgi:hypothetical protein